MEFYINLNKYLEDFIGDRVYPMTIPQGVQLPSIESTMMNYDRNRDSNLSDTNILDYRIQLTVVTKTTKETLDRVNLIVEKFDGFTGLIETSEVLTSRIQNTVPLYNSKLQTYEYAIDITFSVLK